MHSFGNGNTETTIVTSPWPDKEDAVLATGQFSVEYGRRKATPTPGNGDSTDSILVIQYPAP